MKVILWVFMGVILVGCGRGTSYAEIAPDFTHYVQAFNEAAQATGHDTLANDVAIKFGPMTASFEAARCDEGFDSMPTITVEQVRWGQASEDDRTRLIFHELGHCVLHRRHNNALDVNGCPVSAMNAIAIGGGWTSGKCWPRLYNHYVEELFD